VRNDVPAIRAAIDAARHPALLAVDCIASLGCEPFEMDAWGVDVMVAASQKGLMTPPGVAFTFHTERAEAARVPVRSATWDWEPRVRPQQFYQLFAGTPPTHHIFGLREALDMLLHEEGLEAAWERHGVLARALWAAVEGWGSGGALELNIAAQDARSHAVTAIRTRPGEAGSLRRWCEAEAGLTLGIALAGPGADERAMFRIGHMGHLDPPMLLGALATVEAGMKAVGIAHGDGALSAAAAAIAEARPAAPAEPVRALG
jgi:alanine-glyoxylate transaminase / serine-glyoxylate transaminase / serine-pyruvate transaminase